MSFDIEYSNAFKKDFKRLLKRGNNMQLLQDAVEILEQEGTLPYVPYKTHSLIGNFKGYWDAHIQPDWLLIWKTDIENRTVSLARTGSHSDLFK
jgi:mRNA interferase YafQ